MSAFSFPNMFNINNHESSIESSYSTKSIHESFTNLLMTNPGELLGDPAYGCGIKRLLFDINTLTNINEIKYVISQSIKKYISYVNVVESDIKIYSDANNTRYKIIIHYTTKLNNKFSIYEVIV